MAQLKPFNKLATFKITYNRKVTLSQPHLQYNSYEDTSNVS